MLLASQTSRATRQSCTIGLYAIGPADNSSSLTLGLWENDSNLVMFTIRVFLVNVYKKSYFLRQLQFYSRSFF